MYCDTCSMKQSHKRFILLMKLLQSSTNDDRKRRRTITKDISFPKIFVCDSLSHRVRELSSYFIDPIFYPKGILWKHI